jgi:hypothetical protein
MTVFVGTDTFSHSYLHYTETQQFRTVSGTSTELTNVIKITGTGIFSNDTYSVPVPITI